MQELLQSEEQSLLAYKVRVWEAATFLLPLLRLCLKKVIQCTCSHTQKTRWLRGHSDTEERRRIMKI